MRRGLLLTICLMMVMTGFSQKVEKLDNVIVTKSSAIKVGKTRPIRELTVKSATDRAKMITQRRKNTAAPENFHGRNGSNAIRPELEHQGEDPLWQKTIVPTRAASISPIINQDGLSFGGRPADPTGDVGLDYYLQAINATTIAVLDKTDGTVIDEFSGNTLWNSIGESSAGDPIILFDHEVERWVITEFTSPGGTASLLFGISEDSDPLGSYDVYAFVPPNFPDYPKWAIWNDYYIVTTNEEGPGNLHQYIFDRAAFLAGDAEVTMQRVEITGNSSTEAGFYVTTPVSWTGSTAPPDSDPIVMKINDSSWGEVANDALEIFTFDVDLENTTTVTKTTLETTPFDSYPCDAETGGFSCLSQGGAANGVDAIPEVVMNLPHYRNFGTHESIVLSFITDVTDGDNLSGIRWMELRRTTGDWTIYQEGTFAPDDGLHRFMSSISMDQDGNIALAYNTTGPSDFIGVGYTGRYAEDPLGQMTLAEYEVVSGSGSIPGDRFGDYGQIAIDPVDGRTFWYTTEYPTSSGASTRIVAFKLENPNDVAVESIDQPVTSSGLTATETVVATVKNLGENAVSNFDIILQFGGSTIETFNYTGTLNSKDTYQHTFSNTVDLSALGDYELTVEVDFASDEDAGNDVFTEAVTNLAAFNAAVQASAATFLCESNYDIDVTITNEGGETLVSADIEVYVNGPLDQTVNWTGSIATGESAVETVTVTGLPSGDNDVSVVVTNPNGETDQMTSDNQVDLSVNTNGAQFTLTLNTDEYPNETTWELFDESGEILQSGGPYTDVLSTIIEDFCVEIDACYEFVLYDSFGDGICCEFGDGSYTITDDAGGVIFTGGEFGSEESTEFCLGCVLSVDVAVVNQGATIPGSITIEASGSQNIMYSIDGGETFSSESVFENVVAGTYDIVVTANGGTCIYTETVEVTFALGLEDDIQGLTVYPNPTDGVFKISFQDQTINGFLYVDVVDINGKVIQKHRFNRYDESFEGTISLYAYPSGIYFLRLVNTDAKGMVKVIKQ